MKNIAYPLSLVVSLLATGTVLAATIPTSVSTAANAVVMKSGDSGYDTSLTNAVKWQAGATGGTVVTPCLQESPFEPNPAAAEKIFVIPSGKAFRTYKIDSKNRPAGYVKGQALLPGGAAWHLGGYLTPASDFWTTVLTMPPLHVYDSAYFQVNTTIGLSNTTVAVHASRSKPFTFKGTSKFDLYLYENTFRSSDDVGTNAGMSFCFANDFRQLTFRLRDCDFSGFTGQMKVGRANNTSNVVVVVERGGFDMPGEVLVYTNSTIKTRSTTVPSTLGSSQFLNGSVFQVGETGSWQVGDLTMEEGTRFSVQLPVFGESRPACFTVTNRCVLPTTPVWLDVQITDTASELRRLPLFRLAPGVTDAEDQPLALSTELFDLHTTATGELKVETDAEGVQTLWLEELPTVTMTLPDSSANTPNSLVAGGGIHWSDEQDVHGGARYLVPSGKTIEFKTDNFVFPSPVLKLQGTLDIAAPSVTISNLSMEVGSQVRNFDERRVLTLNGRITVNAGTGANPQFYLYQVNNPDDVCGTRIASEIVGDGTLDLLWRGKNLSYGRVELTGMNTNFTGKIQVVCYGYLTPSDTITYTPMSNKFLRVWVHDQRNLGGPIPNVTAPVFNALTVRDRQMLWVTNGLSNDVVFDEPSRGIYVPWWGRFGADSNTTFTIKQQVTYAGRLQKVGAGTLALGGTAKFTSALRDTPYEDDTFLAGTNVLDIAEGALKPLSTEAFAGVAVVFSNNTSIVLDPQSANADVATYGIKSVAAGSSLSVPEGTVAVRFDGEAPTTGFTCPVATLPTEEAATAFMDKLRGTRQWKNFTTSLAVVPRVEGETTVYAITATVQPSGLLVIFR